MVDEGSIGQNIDLNDVEGLKTILVAAHARIVAAESEKEDALKALAEAEAKLQEYTSTAVQATEEPVKKTKHSNKSEGVDLQRNLVPTCKGVRLSCLRACRKGQMVKVGFEDSPMHIPGIRR